MSGGESSTPVAERSATAELPTDTPRSGEAAPSRKGSRIALPVAGTLGVLTVAAALAFGILWGITSADLRNSQDDLGAAQSELSDVQGQLSDTEAELTDTKLAFYNLERGAKYTACVQYYGGFTQGSGFSSKMAVNVAIDSCAAESAWTFAIKPAP